jgi:hypothetical protein
MNLIPPELWEYRSQSSPPTIQKIIKSKDPSYNKWTQVRLHQDPFLKTDKRKVEPIPNPIADTGRTKPSFTTKPKRKHIIRSDPLFKTEMLEEESETDSLPVHSKYINNFLKRKATHDPTFGVYQHDTDGSF